MKDYTLKRNGTEIEIRFIKRRRLVHYVVVTPGPLFLQDMADLRTMFSRTGWRFEPWPRCAKGGTT